jgi:hypothetical protein
LKKYAFGLEQDQINYNLLKKQLNQTQNDLITIQNEGIRREHELKSMVENKDIKIKSLLNDKELLSDSYEELYLKCF